MNRINWIKQSFSFLLTLLFLLPFAQHLPASEPLFLKENFANLDNWKPLFFEKISRHSTYTLDRCGTENCLRMESNNSASALLLKKEFNVFTYPNLRWSWKISTIYSKGDHRKKSGDDYPVRLYVMFAYNPQTASFTQQLQYGLIKAIYGEYPPDSSISYIWANRKTDDTTILVNAYTDRARMIAVDSGPGKINRWQQHQVDILADYRRAFGHDPPARASLAIMSDADDTGESASAWMKEIQLFAVP